MEHRVVICRSDVAGKETPSPHRVGVVGGGPAAVSFCIQLLPKLLTYEEPGVELLVFERGERVGPGLAYTIDPDGNTYRINRTRDTMDPWSGSIGRYTAWAEEHDDGQKESMSDYPLRSNYGKFMVYLMDELKLVSERPGSRLRVEYHTRTTVEDITTSKNNNNKYILHFGGGGECEVDTVVLCTGHYPGATFRELTGKPNYAYTYAGYKPLIKKVLEGEAASDGGLDIGIIGSAYAAIDVTLELLARGHRGKILMACRKGILPATCEPVTIKVFEKSEQNLGRQPHVLTRSNTVTAALLDHAGNTPAAATPEKPRRGGRRKASSVLTEIYSSDPYLGSAYSEHLAQQCQAGTRRLSVMLDPDTVSGSGGSLSGGSKLLGSIRQLIGRLDLASRPSARLKYLGGFTPTNPLVSERRTSMERSLICTNPVLTTIKENDVTRKHREHVVAMPTIITFESAQQEQNRKRSQTIAIPLATVVENQGGESNGTAGQHQQQQQTISKQMPHRKISEAAKNSTPGVRHYRITHLHVDTLPKPLRTEDIVSRVFAEISELQGSRITFDDVLAVHRERTPLELLNEHIACSEAGVVRPWQLVFFTLAPMLVPLWNELDDAEQRLYREKYQVHLMRYFNYIPLESAQKLRDMMAAGKLVLVPGLQRIKVMESPAASGGATANGEEEGGVKGDTAKDTYFEIEGIENDVATTHGVYALFNASGLSSSAAEVPPLANMLKSQLVMPHHFGGVKINRDTHQTLDASGATNEGIYAIGEPCRGYFFVSLDMATVAEQAEKVAGQVAKRIAASVGEKVGKHCH